MMNLYIIGTMAGGRDLNEDVFERARKALNRHGFCALTPHDIVFDAKPGSQFRKQVNYMTSGLVDGIAVLDNAPETKILAAIAQACEMPVYTVDGWLDTQGKKSKQKGE